MLAFAELTGRAPVRKYLATKAVQDYSADLIRFQSEEALSDAVITFQSTKEVLVLCRLLTTVENLVLLEGQLNDGECFVYLIKTCLIGQIKDLERSLLQPANISVLIDVEAPRWLYEFLVESIQIV